MKKLLQSFVITLMGVTSMQATVWEDIKKGAQSATQQVGQAARGAYEHTVNTPPEQHLEELKNTAQGVEEKLSRTGAAPFETGEYGIETEFAGR